MFERIIVPLDGSELGEQAIPWAAEIAAIMNSEIHFISVSQNESIDEKRMRQGYLEHKTHIVESQFEVSGTRSLASKTRSAILEGDSASKIIEYARQQDAGLLVLVSHGKSGIMSWAMGSTASRILSRVKCPVLFIRAMLKVIRPNPLLQQILVPLDGSPKSEEIVPYINTLGTKVAVQVTFVQVINPDRSVISVAGERTVRLPKFELDRLEVDAKAYLNNLVLELPAYQVNTKVCIGKPAFEIMQYAETNNISLIGVTTRGQTRSSEWQFGQIVHKLTQSSKTPLLLVQSKSE